MAMVLTNSQNYTNIANAIRTQNGESTSYTPAQMSTAIQNLTNIPCNRSDHQYDDNLDWTRPLTWPNLDLIDLTAFDGVYLTYDLSKTPGYGWIGVYATTSSGKFTVERGHLEGSTFVVDYSYPDISSKSYYHTALSEENGMIQLWRVYSPSAHLTRIVFTTNTNTNAQNKPLNVQPCVERYGRLPGVTNISSTSPPTSTTSTAGGWGTVWLEHDKLFDMTECTTMASAWYQCYNLKKLEFVRCNASKCTNMSSAWRDCRSLTALDLSGWTTSKVTTLANAWQNCGALRTLDIHNWNVTALTTMTYAFSQCSSLQSLDLSLWTTTTSLTNLSYTWHYCANLKELKIKTLKTGNVITLTRAWEGCYSLSYLDLRGWDVQKVTDLSYTWDGCINLSKLLINDWKPILVTTMTYAWQNCYCLKELDLSTWKPNSLTSLAYAWQYCRSLYSLDLDGWGLTTITSIAYAWYACLSLQELKINGWRPVNAVNMNYAFASCASLERIDISSWGNNVTANNMEYVTNNCRYMRYVNFSSIKHNTQTGNSFRYSMLEMYKLEYCNMTGLDMPSITGAAGLPNHATLVEFYPPILYISFSMSAAVRLSRDSVLRILAALPTIETAKTCTLGQTNRLKVTAEEIAVATAKGWTIA